MAPSSVRSPAPWLSRARVPLARPVNPDNRPPTKANLFVRKNSGIRTVADMKGKKMAFVDKATTAAMCSPRLAQGETAPTLDGFFSEYYFTGA